MGSSERLPSFLPVDNPTTPFWRTELHELDEHRSTPELPHKCDIVIIGAGYAGVSIAYHLLKSDKGAEDEPRPSITILEARQVCSGATGRNGKYKYRSEQNGKKITQL
jgi:NADPH-dependent 2,4-dienoyl-CoA reductase/sulfur reductase-like enzyme